jgi:glycine cleavage system regulatory protein
MRRSLVLTLLGPDRPGLVEAVAALIARHGGNWLESRMASLAGEFAGLLRVEVDEERAPMLESALRSLEADHGLAILVKAAGARGATGTQRGAASADHGAAGEVVEQPAGPLLALELVGTDRPGIVREISQALAAHGVNVEELHTECTSAPMTGETLFRARALLRLPRAAARDELQASVEAIAEDLMVDVTLEPAGSSEAPAESSARTRLRRV